MRIGVVGATGYVGTELLRLSAGHPEMEVAVMASRTARALPASLAAAYPARGTTAFDLADLEGLDLVFLSLPHGESQRIASGVLERVGRVIDLAADYRLHDPADYERWYGYPHVDPGLLGEAAYGLPELFDLGDARLVAAPGCYPTAAALALAPLVRAGVVESEGMVVDAASGVSGAGRSAGLEFSEITGGFSAYGLTTHRHTPEMEQSIGGTVLFTPHLAPMARGILATCYARYRGGNAHAALREAYADSPFVVAIDDPPSTKATVGSNTAYVHARVDERTGWVIALCAIDNLGKGAAGQAMQCANLLFGMDQTLGLALAGVSP